MLRCYWRSIANGLPIIWTEPWLATNLYGAKSAYSGLLFPISQRPFRIDQRLFSRSLSAFPESISASCPNCSAPFLGLFPDRSALLFLQFLIHNLPKLPELLLR